MIQLREFFMIHERRSQGCSISEIARRLNLDRKTVRQYLKQDRADGAVLRRAAPVSKLQPFHRHLKQRLEHYSELSAARLFPREIKGLGYTGGYRLGRLLREPSRCRAA